MFHGLPARDEPEHPVYAAWLAWRLRAEREAFAADPDLTALFGRLVDEGFPLWAAVVVTREVLGPDHCDVSAARDLLLAHPVWAERRPRRGPSHYAQLRLDRL